MTDAIIILLIAIAAFLILRKKLHKMRNGGCSGECCGCSGCREKISPERKTSREKRRKKIKLSFPKK